MTWKKVLLLEKCDLDLGAITLSQGHDTSLDRG